jgi:hypothetical protein
MQRGSKARVVVVGNDKLHMAKFVWLGETAFWEPGGLEVFTGLEQPEECNDDQVGEVGPVDAPDGTVEVEDVVERLDDGDVDGAGSRGRSVFALYVFDVVFEAGVVVGFGSAGFVGAPRVGSTQFLDLLVNRADFCRHSCSDRLTTGTSGSEFDGVDDDVVDTVFMCNHGTEAVGDPQTRAEGVPSGVGIVLGLCGFTGDGMVACRVCSAESMEEIALDGWWCSTQGVNCD